jgi:hypothetical protein
MALAGSQRLIHSYIRLIATILNPSKQQDHCSAVGNRASIATALPWKRFQVNNIAHLGSWNLNQAIIGILTMPDITGKEG